MSEAPGQAAEVVSLDAWRARHEPEPWVRKGQLANHFACSERTLERWQKRGMPCKRVGRRLVLFRVSECEAWLERKAGA